MQKQKFIWNQPTSTKHRFISVLAYRLLYFSLRDALEQEFGHEKTDSLFRATGIASGNTVYKHFCQGTTDFISVAKYLEKILKDLRIGLFRIEYTDSLNHTMTVTVDEDLECAGLPDTDEQICVYGEGFLQGTFEAALHKPFSAREIDCWCTGARLCRFQIQEVRQE